MREVKDCYQEVLIYQQKFTSIFKKMRQRAANKKKQKSSQNFSISLLQMKHDYFRK